MRAGLTIMIGCLLATATCAAQDGEFRQVIRIQAEVISSLHAQSGASSPSAQPDWSGISSAFAPGADASQLGSSPTEQLAANIIAMSRTASREDAGVALYRLQEQMNRRQRLDALVEISMTSSGGEVIHSSRKNVPGGANVFDAVIGDAVNVNGIHAPTTGDDNREFHLIVTVCACNI